MDNDTAAQEPAAPPLRTVDCAEVDGYVALGLQRLPGFALVTCVRAALWGIDAMGKGGMIWHVAGARDTSAADVTASLRTATVRRLFLALVGVTFSAWHLKRVPTSRVRTFTLRSEEYGTEATFMVNVVLRRDYRTPGDPVPTYAFTRLPDAEHAGAVLYLSRDEPGVAVARDLGLLLATPFRETKK